MGYLNYLNNNLMAKKQSSKINTYFTRIDLFPTDVSFRENGGDSFKTCYGACVSLFIILITIFYATNKFRTLVEREDTNFNDLVL